MQETYLGKVKMIYIDPPYNTGNDFIYEDDFAQDAKDYVENSGQTDEEGNRLVQNSESNGRFHTDWLNMIYPRLRLAKDLLSNDGVIFISIDDNELYNLIKIGNEVFGNENYIATIIVKNNSAKNQSKFIGITTEYCVIFARNYSCLSEYSSGWRIKKKGAADINNYFWKRKKENIPLNQIRSEIMELYSRPKYSHLSRWNKIDENGVFADDNLSRANGPVNYTIINPATGKPCPVPSRGWGKSKDELEKLQNEDRIWYGDGSTPPRLKTYLKEDSVSVPDNYFFVDTSSDKRFLDRTIGKNAFPFPKSVDFLKNLIELGTDSNSIIMDFFSGSATTAHAVMQLNAEDGGKRKVILVQLSEKTDEKSEAYKAGYKTICNIGEERIRRAGKKIKEETGADIDYGFRCFKVDSSNMKDIYYRPGDVDQKNLFSSADNIKEDRIPEDLLIQVMLDLGVLLSSKIEKIEIDGKKVFSVADGYLMACFDKDVTEETVTAISKKRPFYAVFRDSSMSTDSVAVNFDQIFETYSPQTIRKVI